MQEEKCRIMVPTTKAMRNPSEDIQRFYNALAPTYDEMTSSETRLIQEKPFFRLLVEKYRIRNAVDAGCGTGFHSLLLSQLGVSVTAIDISAEMLRIVEEHAEPQASASGGPMVERNLRVQIRTQQSTFQNLGKVIRYKNDALFCLGNSIPHLLDERDLRKTLESFSEVLKKDGLLLLQLLNYDRILKRRERIQNIREVNEITYIRFYDFNERNLTFNVLTLDRTSGSLRHTLNSIELRPVAFEELSVMLTDVGFKDIKPYGSISMEAFDPETSKDLVILARK